MKYIKQINNLKIYYSNFFQYCIVSPNKIVLEDRLTLAQAENFCKTTFDFMKNRKVKKV